MSPGGAGHLLVSRSKSLIGASVPVDLPSHRAEASNASFDGAVYSVVTTGHTLVAATSIGLLMSADNGSSWAGTGPKDRFDWNSLAAAKSNVVAGALHRAAFSADSGATWSPIRLPDELTQLSAVAVEPSGTIWVGSREGVFISSDAGNTWTTPTSLYADPVSSILYDDATSAVTVTTTGPHGIVFTVQLPQRSITYFESGWALRFASPVGDHLVAATLFDGLVVQPEMTVSPASQSPLDSSSGALWVRSTPQR